MVNNLAGFPERVEFLEKLQEENEKLWESAPKTVKDVSPYRKK